MTTGHHSRTIGLIAAAFGLVAAGCGSDEATTTATATTSSTVRSSTTPSTTAATTPPPRELKVVGLGDSVLTQGRERNASFVDLFAQQIDATMSVVSSVKVSNLGDPGETSDSLLDKITRQTGLRTVVADADVIVIYVGGNDADPFAAHPDGMCAPEATLDACLSAYAPMLAANLEGIVTTIEGLRAGKPTAIRVSSDYNPFIGWKDAPSPDFGVKFYAQVGAAETAAACHVTVQHRARCVDVFHLFNGPNGTDDAAAFLAGDHAHPGAKGIAAIADALVAVGLSELGLGDG